MSDASFDLGNGLKIDADNPKKHRTPEICRRCNVVYYFGGHFCVENHGEPSKAFKRGIKGYYDGE